MSDHCFSVLSDKEWTAILPSRPHQASAEQYKADSERLEATGDALTMSNESNWQ